MPGCFGWFDDYDDYCYYDCPYSRSCERYTYEMDAYYDEYWF